jgi:hypothetical protein
VTALRSGNKECPTCRKKLVSKRSLRPDPNFDQLVEKIFPNREEYEAHQESILESLSRSHSQNFITSITGENLFAYPLLFLRAEPNPDFTHDKIHLDLCALCGRGAFVALVSLAIHGVRLHPGGGSCLPEEAIVEAGGKAGTHPGGH